MNHGVKSSFPGDISPYDHQLEMDRLLSTEDNFVAVNTAPTGGGKTWSWVVPAHANKQHVIAVYPTNALTEDQRKTIKEYKDKYTTGSELGYTTFTSSGVDEAMKAAGTSLSRGEWMEKEIREGRKKYDSFIVLTNPDVFSRIRRNAYTNTYLKAQSGHFDVVVFDEFHLADTKGWNSLLFLVDELFADTRRGASYASASKFLFLSATPSKLVEDRLKNGLSELQYYDLTRSTGDGRRPWSQVATDDDWRPVMPPVEVELRGGRTFSTAYDLLDDDNYGDVLSYCRGGKTVIMLDSISEVETMHEVLTMDLPNLNVERIDGLKKKDIEAKLRRFDVLVSNSAVEVGIDFKVDRILMSGYQQKGFLQRIGRLRNNDKQLKAICYIPRRPLDGVRTRIEEMYEFLPRDQPVPRAKFEEIIKALFPTPREPALFGPMYSTIEAWMHIEQKASRMTPDAKKDYIINARRRLNRHYFEPYNYPLTTDKLDRIIRKAHSPLNKYGHRTDKDDGLADALMSYRDGGLNTLVYDRQDDEVKCYSLFHFLRHGAVEFLTEEEFLSRVPDRHAFDIRKQAAYSVGYAIYYGRRTPVNDDDTGRKATLRATHHIRDMVALAPEEREPITITGLRVDVDEPINGLDKLNRELESESFLCYAIEGSSHRVQQEYNLDSFFFMYDVSDIKDTYSLALGLNGLYLHCHVVERAELARSFGVAPPDVFTSHEPAAIQSE